MRSQEVDLAAVWAMGESEEAAKRVVEAVMELLVDVRILLEQVILLLQVLLKEILEVQEQ